MPQNRIPVIGVTGITGSGTSTAAVVLAERGGYVAHADKLAHEAMAKTEPAYTEIVSAFGPDILNENGDINRRLLGSKVFDSKEELAKLEKIIHPRVIERTSAMVDKIGNQGGHTFMVIDAPLLIESGMHEMCDSVWLITAPNDLRIARVTIRDSITVDAAKRRLASRVSERTLRRHANIIIENSGSQIALRSKIATALKAMELKIHGWRGCKVLEV